MTKQSLLLLFSVFTSTMLCVAQPQANFSFTDNCTTFNFTDQSTCNGCTIVSWQWDFAGMSYNEQNPTTYFSSNQSLPVSLWVTDNNGNSDLINTMVDPLNCLDVEFTSSSVNCALVVTASVPLGVPPLNYMWYNGEITSSINIVTPGSYAVMVTDVNGNNSPVIELSITQQDIEDAAAECAQIRGRVYNDLNNNGMDDQEPGLAGVQVRDATETYLGYSDAVGNYRVYVDLNNTYTVAPTAPPSQWTCNTWVAGELTEPVSGSQTATVDINSLIANGNDFGYYFGAACATIAGNVFQDQNQNGIQDNGELGAADRNISIANQSGGDQILTQTDAQGNYVVTVPFGTYTVSLQPNNQTYYCNNQIPSIQTYPVINPTYTLPLTAQSPNATANNFGVYNSSEMDARMVNLWIDNGTNAGQAFLASMDFKITGNVTGTCTLRVDHDPLITLNTSGIPVAEVGSDYAQWTFNNPISYCMPLNFTLAPEAEAGYMLNWSAAITCTSPEVCTNNNTVNRARTVQTGPMKTQEETFLPNSMVVLHTGDQQTGMITHDDSTFSYLINFQNVTADTAHLVRIINTISPHLDITSLSGPFSLNPFKMYVPDAETIIFEFDNIVLPDSGSSFIDSYGFVQYNIRMKPNLPDGTIIENQATVSFNREETIPTNVVSNQIALPVLTDETTATSQFLRAFPNPTNGNFNVVFNSSINGAYTLLLHDAMGRVVQRQSFNHKDKSELTIATRLSEGAYLLTVQDNAGQRPMGYQKLLIIE